MVSMPRAAASRCTRVASTPATSTTACNPECTGRSRRARPSGRWPGATLPAVLRRPPACVADVAVMPAHHELGKDRLFEHRRMQVARQTRSCEARRQIAGHDQKSQPQSGKQGLAEAAEVDDSAIGIQCMQTRQRLSCDSGNRSRSRPRRSMRVIGAPTRGASADARDSSPRPTGTDARV